MTKTDRKMVSRPAKSTRSENEQVLYRIHVSRRITENKLKNNFKIESQRIFFFLTRSAKKTKKRRKKMKDNFLCELLERFFLKVKIKLNKSLS